MVFPLVGRRRKHGWLALHGCCGLKLSIYAENLPDEARKAYTKKLKYNHEGLMDPYELTRAVINPELCIHCVPVFTVACLGAGEYLERASAKMKYRLSTGNQFIFCNYS
jgi:hypothetical protein